MASDEGFLYRQRARLLRPSDARGSAGFMLFGVLFLGLWAFSLLQGEYEPY